MIGLAIVVMIAVALTAWYFYASRITPSDLPKLQHGKVLILYGPEGSGKSTLARRYGPCVEVSQSDISRPQVLFEGGHVPLLVIDVYKWTPAIRHQLNMLCKPYICCSRAGQAPRTIRTPAVIVCTTELPPSDERRFVVHNVVPNDAASRDHSCWLIALFVAVLLSGCTSLSTELEHVSHPLAGRPFGPSSEEDALTQANFCARREAGSKGQWYVENCLGYVVNDGGFYGPHLTYTGRIGHKFDLVRR